MGYVTKASYHHLSDSYGTSVANLFLASWNRIGNASRYWHSYFVATHARQSLFLILIGRGSGDHETVFVSECVSSHIQRGFLLCPGRAFL
jgi:hypothetical protein